MPATFHGTRIVTDEPDSPHLATARIRAEMYLSFAEVDSHVEADTAARIKAIFYEHGIKSTVEVVPGTEHGYCFPERAAYHLPAAETAWYNLEALFERTLV